MLPSPPLAAMLMTRLSVRLFLTHSQIEADNVCSLSPNGMCVSSHLGQRDAAVR